MSLPHVTPSHVTPSPGTPAPGATGCVVRSEDVPVGEAVRLTPEGSPPIALFHTEEGFYAIDDTCTHQATSLADGWLEGCAVECPLHEACFDLRTGAPSGPPATVPVRTHPVRVEGEQVIVEVQSPATSARTATDAA